jgi:uncharacterized membrane protein
MSDARANPPADLSRPIGTRMIVGAFAVSGVLHLVRPQVFEPLVPPMLPTPRALVYSSGVAELVCAYGLLRRRRWAPAASAALLLAVWPANGTYALDVQRSGRTSTLHKAVAWARIPLQLPMIRSALRAPVS